MTPSIEYLVRGRLVEGEDEKAALISSLRTYGQRMPIEVTRLANDSERYGLISGWRRLMALRSLYAQTRDARYSKIRALILTSDSARDAYRAMIEENEIRANLSHYECARVALRAVHAGVFPDPLAAFRSLYAASTRTRRSTIRTFISLVQSLDGVLQHPTAISEKLGLALVREAVRGEDFSDKLADQLRNTAARTAAQEITILSEAVKGAQATRNLRSGDLTPENRS